MPNRTLQNYVGLSRSGTANNHFTNNAAKGVERKPKASLLNQLGEYFSENVFAWFIHDWWVRRPFPYPKAEGMVHDITDGTSTEPIIVAVAADWATDTVQSEYIGNTIRGKNPDYTVHLGDTYFSGSKKECEANYCSGDSKEGLWPRGKSGSFTLIGNHEMFSSGGNYFEMITDPKSRFGIRDQATNTFSGQKAPYFCLRSKYWLVLGLDTGYQSLKTGILRLNPDNTQLNFPPEMFDWLKTKVLEPGEKRGVIVLTHHQYVTAFNQESEFPNPAKQIKALLPDSHGIIWIWGHEHRFSMYSKNQISESHIPAFGRCIGNGGMPDEHSPLRFVIDSQAKSRKLVLYDKRIADSIPLDPNDLSKKRDVGFNGYALVGLDNATASITYYASYKINEDDPGRDNPIIQETWEADPITGQISCKSVIDYTSNNPAGDQLTYIGNGNPIMAGQ
jgi:predicted phosphodiesterase